MVVSLHLLLAVAKQTSYDLIYVVHGRLHAFPAAVAGKWLGKPVVVKPGRGGETHFDLSVVQRKRLLGPFFARAIARNTTAWVANSQEIAGDLSRWGVPRSACIHSQRHRRSGGWRRQVKQWRRPVLSMGRLDADKAVDQTIRAFRRLSADTRRSPDDPRRWACRHELEALSRRLGQDGRISSRVRWPT